MTFTPPSDLANYVRFFALYEDGSKDAFAVPQAMLDQGPAPHSNRPHRGPRIGLPAYGLGQPLRHEWGARLGTHQPRRRTKHLYRQGQL